MKVVYEFADENWRKIALYASSIGAYFSLVAYEKCKIERCLFESPILDMERLITNMMGWFGVTESDLEKKQEIETPMGETLSWEYLQYVRENKISRWRHETEILYGENDALAERKTIDAFVKNYEAGLRVVPEGEHYLHSPREVKELCRWLSRSAE